MGTKAKRLVSSTAAVVMAAFAGSTSCGGDEQASSIAPTGGAGDTATGGASGGGSGGTGGGTSTGGFGETGTGGMGGASGNPTGGTGGGTSTGGFGETGTGGMGGAVTGGGGGSGGAWIPQGAELIVDGLEWDDSPPPIALDATYVYVGTGRNVIRRRKDLAGPAERLLPPVNPLIADTIAISGGLIYFVGDYEEVVYAAPLNGGEPTRIGQSESLIHSELAVGSGFVFFSNVWGDVVRIPNSGGSAEVLVSDWINNSADLVALDVGLLYFGGAWNGLKRCNLDGSNPQELMADDHVRGMAFDTTHIYVSVSESVLKIDKATAEIAVTATSDRPTSYFHGLARDETHLYIADRENGIFRVDPNAGPLEEVVEDPVNRPSHLAIDETHVYWTAGFKLESGGEVGLAMRAAK